MDLYKCRISIRLLNAVNKDQAKNANYIPESMQKYYNFSLILCILCTVFLWYYVVGEKVQKNALRRKDNYEKE